MKKSHQVLRRLASTYFCGALYLAAQTSGVVGRSDIVLERPNVQAEEAMPLGNGRLGAALWAAGGLTIQLNRGDTLPRRLSPGEVVVKGLQSLVGAGDYKGRLDLYNGEFRESGGGMKAAVWLDPAIDAVVVDVHGAHPDQRQDVTLHLWQPRQPHASISGEIALLSETWRDERGAGASGETFGSLSAVTAKGRDLKIVQPSSVELELSFLPERDGSFRIWIAAPAFRGGNGESAARDMLKRAQATSDGAHRRWWNDFWNRAGLLKLSSEDGSAAYFENLRAIDLFLAAGESSGTFPGSQAGVGDLFSAARDFHQWDPSAYWHWNLRMQVVANLGAGVADLNAPYFRLYANNLANIERWTKARMQNRPGVCVPETMRFNGQGFENEDWTKAPGRDCDAGSPPYYNARTISTGAEIALWIWRQYQMTDDRAFLAANYPLMADAARFLLAYSTLDKQGVRHTYPSNAHENQWDVHDPTTDISAMRAFFPALIEAAHLLQRDPQLASEAQKALGEIRALPVQNGVIGQSYDPDAPIHNSENVGLEPVWPYQLIGLTGDQHALAVRTFEQRPNKWKNDWSYDPLDAARLGLADEMKTALEKITAQYQAFPSGLAKFVGPEFYREQIGVVAAALQESLAQEFADTLYLAPAFPKSWDGEGTIYLVHRSKIHVRVADGHLRAAIFEAGYTGKLRYQLPNAAATELPVKQGSVYDLLTRRAGAAIPAVQGQPAEHPKRLGARAIGLLR